MERLTDCAQGYCEMYCKKYILCFEDPENCVLKDEIKLYDALKSIEGFVPLDRLLELACADKDGRLVVLPCKVGDMVYEVCNNTDACSGCRNYEGMYGSGESWCTRIDDVDLRSYPDIAERPLCEKQFMEVVEHKPKADWIFNHRNDFGKTVFLTREEAEAALAGKGDTQ